MLSKSAIETWYSCPRKYRYLYVDRYESVYKPRETEIGVVGHTVMETLLDPTTTKEIDDVDLSSLLPVDQRKLKLLYEKWLEYVYVPQNISHLELKFECDKYGLKGIFDGIAQDDDTGHITILEHKFTKTDISRSDWWWDQWLTSWQVGAYQLAAMDLFDCPSVAVWLNAIRVPQLRQGRSESDDEYIVRCEEHIEDNPGNYFIQKTYAWSAEELKAMEKDLAQTITAISDAHKHGEFPKSRNCFAYGRKCEFYPVCFEQASLQDNKLYQIRTKK